MGARAGGGCVPAKPRWTKLLASCLAAGAAVMFACAARGDTITLRSGNAPRGSSDPDIRCSYVVGSCPLSMSSFTPADFAGACTGPQAFVITPHPAWLTGLSTDPLAQWIG